MEIHVWLETPFRVPPGKSIHHHETDVVPGFVILVSGIPEAKDENTVIAGFSLQRRFMPGWGSAIPFPLPACPS